MNKQPAHLQPQNCYVCGRAKDDHGPNAGHTFWSNADAEAAFAREIQANTNVEARYVEQHRPY